LSTTLTCNFIFFILDTRPWTKISHSTCFKGFPNYLVSNGAEFLFHLCLRN